MIYNSTKKKRAFLNYKSLKNVKNNNFYTYKYFFKTNKISLIGKSLDKFSFNPNVLKFYAKNISSDLSNIFFKNYQNNYNPNPYNNTILSINKINNNLIIFSKKYLFK
jgi:hypothetical protein